MSVDFDDAFANSAYIPGSESLPALWAAQAQAYRHSGIRIEEDLPYGPAARQRFDLIRPEGEARGLVVFIHGGYWLAFGKSDWTDLAEGARRSGYAVAIPSYTLAPEARISQITCEIGAAITGAAALVGGELRLAGHSAGGHLVSRMICEDSPLAPGLRARITRVLSISGLHDLRLLRRTGMNATLRLDAAEAEAESPALLMPMRDAALTCYVGGDERPEFLRQSRLMALIWQGLARTRLVEEPGQNHFSILAGLKEPGSAIMAELLR